MKLFARLAVLAMAATIAATGATYASTKPGMMSATRSNKPACKGATVYAVAMQKIYYVKGETMYGHAKGGSYMCMAAANGKGYKKH